MGKNCTVFFARKQFQENATLRENNLRGQMRPRAKKFEGKMRHRAKTNLRGKSKKIWGKNRPVFKVRLKSPTAKHWLVFHHCSGRLDSSNKHLFHVEEFVKKFEPSNFVLPKKKKDQAHFWLKELCQILCPKNKKNSSENFLFKKKCCFFWFTKRKRKTRLWCRKFWLKLQNSAHFVWGKVCLLPKTKQRTLAFGRKTSAFFFVFFRVVFSSK